MLKVGLLRTTGITLEQEIHLTGKKKNAIVNSAVYKILLHGTKKASAAKQVPEFLESDYYEN